MGFRDIKSALRGSSGQSKRLLDYIASGQIYEDFGGSGKTPNIKVIFCHKPTEEVEFILNKIKETVTNNGYTFEWIYRPVP